MKIVRGDYGDTSEKENRKMQLQFIMEDLDTITTHTLNKVDRLDQMGENQLAVEMFKLALGQAWAEIEKNSYNSDEVAHYGVHTVNQYGSSKFKKSPKTNELNNISIVVKAMAKLCAINYELQGEYLRAERQYAQAGVLNKAKEMGEKQTKNLPTKYAELRTSRIWKKSLAEFKRVLANHPVDFPSIKGVKDKLRIAIETVI